MALNPPVLLITFNRPEHTRRTLQALLVQSLELLYVFQDGPREGNKMDNANCLEVRRVIDDCLEGKPIEIRKLYCDANRGCREAVIYAITQVLKEHEEVIVIEDDIITSPAFFAYMSKALAYYKDKKTVFSISGHSHSPDHFRIPDDYPYDVYASPRLFNWGWGTWRDRWEHVDWSLSYFEDFMKKSFEKQAFSRGGDDLIPMLVDEYMGRSSAWDIQFAFAHFTNHAVSVVPCCSYTMNIGQDGSGTHCGDIGRQVSCDITISRLNQNVNPVFLDTLYFDSRIINLQYSYFSRKKRPIWQKFVNFIARRLKLKPPFIIKGKVFV